MKPAAAAALAWAVRLLSALSLLFTSGPVLPQTALEQQVRAAFLYNFARFTSWPVERVADSAPIVFCTLEHEPLGAALASTLAGKSIDQHLLQVRVATSAEDMRSCQVAYLGAADAALQARVLRSLAGSGVLTVYDAAERRPGGAIRMFVEDQRMRFEVNTAVVEREHLELSSRLLGVAQLVRDP